MAVRDESSGIETITTFEQAYPHVGWVTGVEKYRAALSDELVKSGCETTAGLCLKSFTLG